MSGYWSLTDTEFSVSVQLCLHSTSYWMNVSLLDAFKIPVEYTLTFTAESEPELTYIAQIRAELTVELAFNTFSFDIVFL